MEEKIKSITKKELHIPVLTVMLLSVILLGFLMIGQDMQSLLRWEIGLFCLGIGVLPLVAGIFGKVSGKEYLFGRIIGLCLASFAMWQLSFWRILKFSAVNIILVTVILGVVVYTLPICLYGIRKRSAKGQIGKSPFEFLREEKLLEKLIAYEIAFLAVFLFCTWFLGHKIPGNETERLMDFAFMQSLNKSDYMPPLDVWAAGEKINYYYYGQYMMTVLSKLSFVDIKQGYSLALSFIMCATLVFVYTISSTLMEKSGCKKRMLCVVSGILSAVSVGLFGNFHYVVFYKIIPTLFNMLKLPGEEPSYWFAESTRYIGYVPVNEGDRTISEFPFYSFLIGDLHAHVIDIVVVLTIIAVMSACFFKMTEHGRNGRKINLNLIIVGFLTGIASMSNYWDFIIYFTFTLVVLLVINLLVYGNTKTFLALTALQGGLVLIIVKLTNFMFMSEFEKMFDGIGVVSSRSYISQLLVLWGTPISCVILFFLYLLNKKKYTDSEVKLSDGIIIVLGICGTGLCIIPELVYVKDIYINGFPRANTMFKLTYQAFILFGIAMGYILMAIINAESKEEIDIKEYFALKSIKRFATVLLLLLILTGGYFFTASRMWMGEIKTWKYQGLDATKTIVDNMGGEAEVLKYIEDNIPAGVTILVANGNSYTDNCVIPALTGNPTVLGWYTHEWLWHNSGEYVEKRQADVLEIYTGTNEEIKKELIEEYNIEYIYIGDKERGAFADINTGAIEELGTVVYSDDAGRILYKINAIQ